MISKTKVQLSQLSGRQVPIAGATGAKVTDDEPAPEPRCPSPFSGPSAETYAVRFIQHTPEPPVVGTLVPLEADQYSSQRPEMRYALKHSTGKRITFSQAQKDIMIEFYNRQAINSIRAEPKDVMKAMEEAGLEVLSATQIRSWWSSYHRKNKQTPATPSASVRRATPSASVQNPMPSASIQHATPSASLQNPTPSASVQHATPSASVQNPMPSASVQHATPSASVQNPMPSVSVQHAMASTSVPNAMP